MALHGAGLLADRGLRDAVKLRGLRETLGLNEICEYLKIVDLYD
jgi:hypothetical protein